MNFRNICIWSLGLIFSAGFNASAQDETTPSHANKDWVKIYYETCGKRGIDAHPVAEIDSIFYTAVMSDNPDWDGQTSVMTINVDARNSKRFSLPVDSIQTMVLGTNIPTIYIETDPVVSEVTSKTDYLSAQFRYIPYGDGTNTVAATVSIRGRGNSTWDMPKKPYRLKFDKKQSIGELYKAKSFVLIANYIDNTLMKNVVAFKMAELMGIPYANKFIPVNVVFNGIQKGSYMLTNKVGINSGSVDIDEDEGILWELDTHLDEEFKYISDPMHLPCMVKDPDFHEITGDDPIKIEELWNYWQEDLNKSFASISEGNWQEAFDAEQLVKFFVLNDIVQNHELSYPKSLYIYKETHDSKYKMGPVWDHDWSFGYNQDPEEYMINKTASYRFYEAIFKDEAFQEMFRTEFDDFCENHLEDLFEFIDAYALLIRDSAIMDSLLWPADTNLTAQTQERHANNFEKNVENLKQWILTRIEVIKTNPNFALYSW